MIKTTLEWIVGIGSIVWICYCMLLEFDGMLAGMGY